jgi:transcription antitermination factor NusG
MTLTESWYAVHVKPRAELSVARHLDAKGYQQFVPLYRSRRRWADRVKELEMPLFPQYVFCRTTINTSGRIVTTPGVIRLVGVGNMPVPIEDHEIEALQLIVNTRLRAEPWPFLQIGQRVELAAGPLKGMRGILVRFANGNRLIVSVTLLQRSVSVEVHGHDVVPVDSPAWREGAA